VLTRFRYCENGSLTNICKRFGKFPENLVAVYIYQVLQGMAYLHQQGTVHRDIKGANILTTKDGLAKLADFGVATRITNLGDQSVVGTPNWMAPEVIELNGASTASDIWSLGCTIIELLTGKPPYHNLRQMPALFAIVNDDHPPIPDGLSPQVQDFLLQCFQKDPNLRVSARKLLKHPWMLGVAESDKSKRYMTTKYDDAVKTVQLWNDAIQKPLDLNPTPEKLPKPNKKNTAQKKSHKYVDLMKYSEDKENHDDGEGGHFFSHGHDEDPFVSIRKFSQSKRKQFRDMVAAQKEESWDNVFEEGELSNKMKDQLRLQNEEPPSPEKKSEVNGSPRTPRRMTGDELLGKDSPYREEDDDDYSDLQGEFNVGNLKATLNDRKVSNMPPVFRPSDLAALNTSARTPSPQGKKLVTNLQEYTENDDENDDYSSIFGNDGAFSSASSSFVLHQSSSRYTPSKRTLDSDDSEEDPFALIDLEDNYESGDMATDAARDRNARANSQVQSLVQSLNEDLTPEELSESSNKMLNALREFPETKKTVIKSHGLLPILEVLESQQANRDISHNLLQCVNELVENDYPNLENLCLIGGIPMITKFTSRDHTADVRYQAAVFVDVMCRSEKLILQMFISCGGLYVLSEFLEEDYLSQKELVLIGIRGIWNVFQLQGSTPRNDICRILSWGFVLGSLSEALPSILSDDSLDDKDDVINMVTSIFFFFSRTESYVKESIASKNVFRSLFKCYHQLPANHQLTVLKFIKNLSSVQANFTILQNSNAIEVLVNILAESCGTARYKETASQILHIMFNLCRLSRERQEEAAVAGIVPLLQEVVSGDLPLKQIALPILCDLAHAGKTCRKILWQHDGLSTYLYLTSDPYWQVNAYEAICIWLQEEAGRIEDRLVQSASKQKLLSGLDEAKSNTFNALLESFHKLLRLSPRFCRSLSVTKTLSQLRRRIKTSKAMVRLNLLRVARTILEYNPTKISALEESGLAESLRKLTTTDNPVLVRELAKELLSLKEGKKKLLFTEEMRAPERQITKEGRMSPPRMIPRNRPSRVNTPAREVSEKRR
jgi:serine/threonine protein kinase